MASKGLWLGGAVIGVVGVYLLATQKTESPKPSASALPLPDLSGTGLSLPVFNAFAPLPGQAPSGGTSESLTDLGQAGQGTSSSSTIDPSILTSMFGGPTPTDWYAKGSDQVLHLTPIGRTQLGTILSKSSHYGSSDSALSSTTRLTATTYQDPSIETAQAAVARLNAAGLIVSMSQSDIDALKAGTPKDWFYIFASPKDQAAGFLSNPPEGTFPPLVVIA